MTFRIFLVAALLAGATGCATVKGWLGGKKDPTKPAELVEIAGALPVREAWNRGLGDGRERQGLRVQPAVDGDRLYVANDEGRVLALDAGTGAVVWDSEAVATGRAGSRWAFWKRRIVEGGVSGGPGVGDGLVVAGGRDGEVVALDAATGAERWRAKAGTQVTSVPLVGGGMVVVRGGDGRAIAFDAANGSRRWLFERSLPALTVRGNGSPVVAGGLIFLGYDDGTLVAVRPQDGAQAWEQVIAEPEGRNDLERMADVDGELAFGPGQLFATSYRGRTMAFSTDSGQPLWTRDVGSAGGVTWAGDKVLLSDTGGNVWALDPASGSAVWKQDALARRWPTTPVVHGEYAVVGDIEGYLHWIRLADGTLAARTRVQRSPILGTPQVSASGLLYVVTAGGELAAFPAPN